MSERFDVIVAGGGMVGATVAALLARAGMRVAVVEQQPTNSNASAEAPDLRVSSINLGAAEILKRAGAWGAITRRRACPFRRVRVWDRSGAETAFDAGETGHEWLGWFVENGRAQ